MMRRFIFLVISIIAASCNLNNRNKFLNTETKGRNISIFRSPHDKQYFYLRINNDFEYLDNAKKMDNVCLGELITKYHAVKDSITIYLKITDRDTLFKYDISEHDSLLLGLSQGRNFFVFNETEYVWRFD